MPKGVHSIKSAVTEFAPATNSIKTSDGKVISYDYLIVAAGIQIDWDRIKGLKESVGKNGVCTNYSYDTVNSTWENIKNFKGGTAIFTQPPQKRRSPLCLFTAAYFQSAFARNLACLANSIYAVEIRWIFISSR